MLATFATERERRAYVTVAALMGCLCTIAVSSGVGALTWSFLEWLGMSKGICALAALPMASSTALFVGRGFPIALGRIVRGEW